MNVTVSPEVTNIVAAPTEVSVTAETNQVFACLTPDETTVIVSESVTQVTAQTSLQQLNVTPNNYQVILQTPGPQGPSCCDNVNTVPTVVDVPAPLANTEYSYALPANCKGFIVKSRLNAIMNFGYAPGVLTTFLTVPLGCSYEDDNFYSAQTIYFSTNKAGNTVEIVTFV